MRYPDTFNLKKHMATAMDSNNSQNGDKLLHIQDEIYDLYAVCVHSGFSTNSGHYYSYCKTN